MKTSHNSDYIYPIFPLPGVIVVKLRKVTTFLLIIRKCREKTKAVYLVHFKLYKQ